MMTPIPPPPRTQALNSTTFSPPPIDGTLTIPEIYDWHMEHTPNHPLFVFADGPGSTRTILWPEAVRAIHEVGRLVQSRLQLQQEGQSAVSSLPVVAILSAADTITYFTTLVGVIRAGYVPFPISPRNSAAALAHLLSKTNAVHVLLGAEQSLQNLFSAAFELLEEGSVMKSDLRSSDMPIFEDVYTERVTNNVAFQPLPPVRPDMDAPALILHSSGSTAFPKPILWSHRRHFQTVFVPFYGERDLTGQRLACHGMPMYHGMGMIQTGWMAGCGLVLTAFKPQSPAITPTPDLVLKGSVDSESDIIFCVPSFVESWARNPDDVRNFQKVKGILYGGGPLNKKAGDYLTQQGVEIFNSYGATEMSFISTFLPKTTGLDWDYFRISPHVKPILKPDGQGHYELFISHSDMNGQSTIYHAPCVVNAEIDGDGVYATNDLLIPHPEKPEFWKIHGRTDDQIMHNTGEKTNPGPLENLLNQDPHVLSSVMFGRGRFYPGVLIDPVPAHKFDPADTAKLEQFRNAIWSTIERLNEYAPQHSRIFKEMILVASPSNPFTYTAKSTVRRQAVINNYETEIEALYAGVAETTQPHIPLPATWSDKESLEFVRAIVSTVMKRPVGDTDDLFQHGCDSLQATWIRNSLLHALRSSTRSNTRLITPNVVYEHPSISAMAAFACQFALPAAEGERRKLTNKVEAMLSMVSAYSLDFPKHNPSVITPSKDVVMVTGTTGGFGSSLLAELIACNDIIRVFAVNRKNPSGATLFDRQTASLRRQGLDPAIALSPKVTLVEADVSASDLELSSDVFESIRSSVTHIIHNAWRVDFNIALQSFEPQVKGVRNLIDLALTSPHVSPPRLLFTSSVGVFRQQETVGPAKESPIGPEVAVGSGYSESKWVSERLLEVAAARTPLEPTTIRIGQICGGPNGFWNEKEWLPSLIRSSVHLKCLPSSKQLITWIPSAIAAKSIVEMRHSSAHILHLAHPRPVLWSVVSETVSAVLKIPLVPYSEWLARLEKSRDALMTASAEVEANAIRSNPALQLIDFFRGVSTEVDIGKEVMGVHRLSLDQAKKASRTLRDEHLRQVGVEDVSQWLEYWKSTGSLPQ